VIRDISVHYKLAETKRNNKVLHLLTNSVSRQLLTPIGAVVAVGQNMKENQKMNREEIQNKIGIIVNAGKLLDNSVKSLLDKSLTDNDLQQPQLNSENLLSVVKECEEMMQSQGSLRSVTIQTRSNIAGNGILELDKTRVQQIILHLLSNAIKFSSSHSLVTIEVKTTNLSATQVTVVILIRDTGVGIPPEDIKNLFKPYFKSTYEQSKLLNVTNHDGMGLMICDRITASLGGTIEVDSELNCGSTFTVTFIAQKTVIKPKVPKLVSISPSSKAKRQHLIVLKQQNLIKKKNSTLNFAPIKEEDDLESHNSSSHSPNKKPLQTKIDVNIFHVSFDDDTF
jgi:signal transduction histidine kinase